MSDSTCSSCGAAVLWITLLGNEGGKPHPVDVDSQPTPAVNLIAVRRVEFAGLNGILLTKTRLDSRLAEFERKGAKWYRSHFATCPHAESHRRHDPAQEGLF